MLPRKLADYVLNSVPKDHQCCAIVWSREDVLSRAGELNIECSDEQADEVICAIDRSADASMGISWATIDVYLEELCDSPQLGGKDD